MERKKDKKGRLLKNGERQRSDGRYEYRYVTPQGDQCSIYSWRLVDTDPTPQGKRHCEPLRTLETKILEQEIMMLDSKKASTMTFEDAFNVYMSVHPKWKPSTRYNKRSIYRCYVQEQFGRQKVIDIRHSSIKKYYIYLQEKRGLSIATVEQVHIIIFSVLECMVNDNVIWKNPAKNAMKDVALSERKKHHALSQAQQDRLVKFVGASKRWNYYYPLIIFLLGTGVRIGEASALQWENIDFKNNCIYIDNNMVEYRDDDNVRHRDRTTPKTEAGIREIPMLDDVRIIMKQEYAKAQFKLKRKNLDGERVFKTTINTEIKQTYIDQLMNRINDDFNETEEVAAAMQNREPDYMPPFTPHTFRRTFCTRLCEKEQNIKVIQRVMGHKDIQTTMNIYAEATKDFVKDTFDNLEMKIV